VREIGVEETELLSRVELLLTEGGDERARVATAPLVGWRVDRTHANSVRRRPRRARHGDDHTVLPEPQAATGDPSFGVRTGLRRRAGEVWLRFHTEGMEPRRGEIHIARACGPHVAVDTARRDDASERVDALRRLHVRALTGPRRPSLDSPAREILRSDDAGRIAGLTHRILDEHAQRLVGGPRRHDQVQARAHGDADDAVAVTDGAEVHSRSVTSSGFHRRRETEDEIVLCLARAEKRTGDPLELRWAAGSLKTQRRSAGHLGRDRLRLLLFGRLGLLDGEL